MWSFDVSSSIPEKASPSKSKELFTAHMSPDERTKFKALIAGDPDMKKADMNLRIARANASDTIQMWLQWLSSELWIHMPFQDRKSPIDTWDVQIWLWWQVSGGLNLWIEWSWSKTSQDVTLHASKAIGLSIIWVEHQLQLNNRDGAITTDSLKLSKVPLGIWSAQASISQKSDGLNTINMKFQWNWYTMWSERKSDGSYSHSVIVWEVSTWALSEQWWWADKNTTPYLSLRQDYDVWGSDKYGIKAWWNISGIDIAAQAGYDANTWDNNRNITILKTQGDARISANYHLADVWWGRSEVGSIWVSGAFSEGMRGNIKVETNNSTKVVAWLQGTLPGVKGSSFSVNVEWSKNKSWISLGIDMPL